jgi:hypothetical protein
MSTMFIGRSTSPTTCTTPLIAGMSAVTTATPLMRAVVPSRRASSERFGAAPPTS